MSLILKGIDMPKSCGECKFFCGLGYGFHCYLNGKHITFIGEVENFCPLVEIPTPHGRLIDGDKIETDMIYAVIDNLKNDAPTILEAEE